MTVRPFRYLTPLLVLALAGCGGTTTDVPPEMAPEIADVDPAADASRWPRDFVVGPGSGPALFLSEAPDAPGIGYVSEGTPVRIGSLPQNGRIKVRVDGPLKVRGWLTTERLSLIVTEGGRVPETPISLSPGDYVRYLGPADEEGLARIRVSPRLGREDVRAQSFTGVFPLDRLANSTDAEVPDPDHSTARRLPSGQEISLYTTPDEVAATLPATEPGLVVELARDRGRWKGVRVGVGPRLIGYVNVDLEVAEALPSRVRMPEAAEGEVPMRLRVDGERPLWRVAPGSRIRYGDTTIAIVDSTVFAREMGRFAESEEADVFVAGTDAVALRGTVAIEALTTIPDASPSAAQGAATTAPATAPATSAASRPPL